jgi:hypothetical protein
VESIPAVTVMRRAREEVTQVMESTQVGGVLGVLEFSCRVWEEMELARLQILLGLAQIQQTGNLRAVGGQRTLAGWLVQALGVNQYQARSMAVLAELLRADKLPDTHAALLAGRLSVDEAAAVAKVIEQTVGTRDRVRFEEADLFRRVMDAEIMAAKNDNPALSGTGLMRQGRQIAAKYHPSQVENQHEKARQARRADLDRAPEGAFRLQVNGHDADAEILDKALAAYTEPYDPNKPEASKAQRTYDALIEIMRVALGHQECATAPGPLAMINITVPLDVYTGQRQEQEARGREGGFATTQDGQVIAMEAVRDLAKDSVLRRVIIDPHNGKPLDVGRGVRNAPEQIRTAANHGHTTCAWTQGCDVRVSETEADHIRSFSKGGKTSVDNIQPLCPFHNRLKWQRGVNPHRQAWSGRSAHRKPTPDSDPDPPPDPDPSPDPDTVPRD